MPKQHRTISQKTKAMTLTTMIMLLVVVISLFPLSNVTNQVVGMKVIGESVKLVEAGESAKYPIEVENKGPVDARVELATFGVPAGWEAHLSDESMTLLPGETGLVFLSVSAPSTPAEEEAQVAGIGVRANDNVTIGTITILRGSATLTRGGVESALKTGDEIRSGDLIENTGESIIALDPNKLVNATDRYEGIIYVLLSDATVGFFRVGDTAYMTFVSGEVTIWVPGGGGGRSRDPPPNPVINLTQLEILNLEFPDLEYQGFMEFGDLDTHSFFHLNVEEENTTVEVFEGGVDVGTNATTRTLDEFEQTTMVRTEPVPEPTPVQRAIITLESEGSVEASVESQGVNVLDLPDVHYMPTDELQLFVTPVLPEITVDLEGKKDGEYTVDITQITDFTQKKFEVKSTATEDTTDDLIFEDETLKFEDMEEDKTYNLTISYEDSKTGEESQFEVVEVKTSDEDQSIAVDDWEKLDEDEEKPVTFKEGDTEVKVSEGTTGEELEKQIEEERKEEEFPWLVVGVVTLLVILLVGAAAYLGYIPILVAKKKGLIVLRCELSPESPVLGEETEMVAILRNDGDTVKADEHTILVTFFDEFDPIDELDVSDTEFASGEELTLPAVTWTPEKTGERPITVVIEIDGTEVEEHSFTVVVKGEKEELTDDSEGLDERTKLEESLEETEDDE